MAQFRIGQKVKVIAAEGIFAAEYIGQEAVIVDRDVTTTFPWVVILSRAVGGTTEAIFHDRHLAPLTDPKAEEFLARLKKLGTEPVVLTPKQLAHG